jgi:hypothetical protein
MPPSHRSPELVHIYMLPHTLLLYCCFTAEQMPPSHRRPLNLETNSVSGSSQNLDTSLHCCFTAALLLTKAPVALITWIHYFTAALLLLYCCFTANSGSGSSLNLEPSSGTCVAMSVLLYFYQLMEGLLLSDGGISSAVKQQ